MGNGYANKRTVALTATRGNAYNLNEGAKLWWSRNFGEINVCLHNADNGHGNKREQFSVFSNAYLKSVTWEFNGIPVSNERFTADEIAQSAATLGGPTCAMFAL
jgi:hypothetical protein